MGGRPHVSIAETGSGLAGEECEWLKEWRSPRLGLRILQHAVELSEQVLPIRSNEITGLGSAWIELDELGSAIFRAQDEI